MKLAYKYIESPVGRLQLAAVERGIVGVQWNRHGPLPGPWSETQESATDPLLLKLERQLAEYFAGERLSFDLPLALRGTDFQLKVWNALCRIPYGATFSYKQLATSLKRPDAPRAVGSANGQNPIAIVVPCHRVIGANGSLTGFAGGLERKRFLLDLENRRAASQLQLF